RVPLIASPHSPAPAPAAGKEQAKGAPAGGRCGAPVGRLSRKSGRRCHARTRGGADESLPPEVPDRESETGRRGPARRLSRLSREGIVPGPVRSASTTGPGAPSAVNQPNGITTKTRKDTKRNPNQPVLPFRVFSCFCGYLDR